MEKLSEEFDVKIFEKRNQKKIIEDDLSIFLVSILIKDSSNSNGILRPLVSTINKKGARNSGDPLPSLPRRSSMSSHHHTHHLDNPWLIAEWGPMNRYGALRSP